MVENSTNTSNDGPFNEFYSIIGQEILFAIICIVGLIGNTLVIYVIIRFSKMQTVTNMYIVNLAIADELFLIGIPFLLVTLFCKRWIFGAFMCKTYMTLTSINQFTSSTFLCIMSADRYIAVCHPISSPRWRTPCISKVVSCLAWVWSITLMIPIVIHTEQVPRGDGHYSCQIFSSDVAENTTSFMENSTSSNDTDTGNQSTVRTFTLYNFSLGFAAPLSLILIFYYLVIQKLKTVGPQNRSKEKKRSHRKVTNLVLTVITVYILCWLPYWLSQLAVVYEEYPSEALIIVHIITSCLTYSNSAVNPILYAFLSENFKKSFLKACICAAGKDVNAALYMETSIFPRKSKSESTRIRSARITSIIPNEDDFDTGPLVAKYDSTTSAITMTSRLSIDATGRTKEVTFKKDELIAQQPTSL